MLSVEVLDNGAVATWDDFVTSHPRGTLFHSSEWLTTCEQSQSARLVRLGFFQERRLVGVFPVFLKRFGLLRVAASPMKVEDTPYMGPLWKEEVPFPEMAVAFDKYLCGSGVHFIRFHSMDKLHEGNLPALGYRHVTRHTHVIDLTLGEAEIWKRMAGSARRNIRKAEKSEVQVSVADPDEQLDTYLELANVLYTDQNKTIPNTPEFYRSILSGRLGEHTQLVVARVEGRVISAAILMHYKERAFYLDGVNDKRYGPLNASAAVQWFLIRRALELGCRSYDFVGSDLPWIAAFKAKFGGQLVGYSLFEKARPAWVFALRGLYGNRIKPFAQRCRATLARLAHRRG